MQYCNTSCCQVHMHVQRRRRHCSVGRAGHGGGNCVVLHLGSLGSRFSCTLNGRLTVVRLSPYEERKRGNLLLWARLALCGEWRSRRHEWAARSQGGQHSSAAAGGAGSQRGGGRGASAASPAGRSEQPQGAPPICPRIHNGFLAGRPWGWLCTYS